MTRTIAISLDQFYRPQPGGIATYVRGLIGGLREVGDDSLHLVGVAPKGEPLQDISDLAIKKVSTIAPVEVLTRVWARWPLGVASMSSIVHATSLAGPFAGGQRDAVHSVAMHDLLWRDEPTASTARGIAFHEHRLQMLKRRYDVRIITTAPGLAQRLIAEGIASERVHESRLGVGDATVPTSRDGVTSLLAEHGVVGPFTLYAGTREPRKNLQRLMDAHQRARGDSNGLGPLVLVGPQGWGSGDVGDAVVLGMVSRADLLGLYRDATVFAYVPIAEGWGLPPVEALNVGARVVASATTPSITNNHEVVLVDPLDVDSISDGLVRALSIGEDDLSRQRRRDTVSGLTWKNVALDHLAAWQ